MSYINCSAYDLQNAEVFATKKALKEAVATRPDKVLLTTTSELGPGGHRQITANMVTIWENWQVVGPTPLNRKWYATVSAKGNPTKAVVK